MKIEKFDDIIFAILFFLPGFILLAIRGKFIVSGTADKDDRIFRYLVATAFNYLCSSPLVFLLLFSEYFKQRTWLYALGLFGVTCVNPIILGIFWAYFSQNHVSRKILT